MDGKNLEEVKNNNIKTSQGKNQNKEATYQCDKTKYWIAGIVGFVVLVLLVGGLFGVFFLTRANHRQFGVQRNIEGMRRGQMQGGPHDKKGMMKKNTIEGKVTAVGDKTFTLDQDGQSKNVQISDSTRFPIDSKTSVAVGDEVLVWGEQDSNGMIQATRIIVNFSANNS